MLYAIALFVYCDCRVRTCKYIAGQCRTNPWPAPSLYTFVMHVNEQQQLAFVKTKHINLNILIFTLIHFFIIARMPTVWHQAELWKRRKKRCRSQSGNGYRTSILLRNAPVPDCDARCRNPILAEWASMTMPMRRLKVPKCEIFNLMDSRDFYTIKSPWVCDFGTVTKNSKLFRFRHDFEVFFPAKMLSKCMLPSLR